MLAYQWPHITDICQACAVLAEAVWDFLGSFKGGLKSLDISFRLNLAISFLRPSHRAFWCSPFSSSSLNRGIYLFFRFAFCFHISSIYIHGNLIKVQRIRVRWLLHKGYCHFPTLHTFRMFQCLTSICYLSMFSEETWNKRFHAKPARYDRASRIVAFKASWAASSSYNNILGGTSIASQRKNGC